MEYKMNKILLKHPQMRIQLIKSLKDLSDKNLHTNHWSNKKFKHSLWDNFSLRCEVLFEDLLLDGELPSDQIGYSLYNQYELNLVLNLIKKINEIYEKIGPNKKDTDYFDSYIWDEMIELASIAYKALINNEAVQD